MSAMSSGSGGYYYDPYRGGLPYDSTNAPSLPGSGGGSTDTTPGTGGDGGGAGGGRIAVWCLVAPADRERILTDPDNPTVIRNIAVSNDHTQTNVPFSGMLSATNGISTNAPASEQPKGTPGAIVFLTVQTPRGAMIYIR